MSATRRSLELPPIEQGKNVQASKDLQTRFETLNIQLVNKVKELNAHKMDDEDTSDSEEGVAKDPAIVAMEVEAQIVRGRKSSTVYIAETVSPGLPTEA